MIDALTLARILALAGFFPASVMLIMIVMEWRPFACFDLPRALREHDQQRLRRSGQEMLFVSLIVGISPDIFVMLEPDVAWLLLIDRALDGVAGLLLVGGLVMWRGSSAQNPKGMLVVWFGAVFISATAASVIALF